MGMFMRELEKQGYNAKEKAYVIGGAVVGALAPIVAARYLFFNMHEGSDIVTEAIAWGASIFLNIGSMIIPPHIPLPIYTMAAGISVGTVAAERSIGTKHRNDNLETLAQEN